MSPTRLCQRNNDRYRVAMIAINTTIGPTSLTSLPITTAATRKPSEPTTRSAAGSRLTATSVRTAQPSARERTMPCSTGSGAASVTGFTLGRAFSRMKARPIVALMTARKMTMGRVFFLG